jgi:uncharacterized protein YyaL (SSP411 family)
LLQMPEDDIRARLKAASAKLYEARAKRIWPGRDEKLLTSWNGLMIAAFAHAGAAFGTPRFVQAAANAADFILGSMVVDGTLYRTCAVGGPARIPGYLEDYACLIDGLIELFQATFELRWLEAALSLAEGMLARFADLAGGAFFSTATDHRHLIVRGKESYDGSTPSGNSMAVTALLKLAKLTGRGDLQKAAEGALSASAEQLQNSPGGTAQMLSALDFYLNPVTEIVVIGNKSANDSKEVLASLHRTYIPNKVLLAHDPVRGRADENLLPSLNGKTGGPEVTTYICRGETCLEPMRGSSAVAQWLKRVRQSISPLPEAGLHGR